MFRMVPAGGRNRRGGGQRHRTRSTEGSLVREAPYENLAAGRPRLLAAGAVWMPYHPEIEYLQRDNRQKEDNLSPG